MVCICAVVEGLHLPINCALVVGGVTVNVPVSPTHLDKPVSVTLSLFSARLIQRTLKSAQVNRVYIFLWSVTDQENS